MVLTQHTRVTCPRITDISWKKYQIWKITMGGNARESASPLFDVVFDIVRVSDHIHAFDNL